MKDPSTFASLRRSDDDYNNDGDYYEYDGDSHQNHNSSAMSKVLNDLAEVLNLNIINSIFSFSKSNKLPLF